MSLLDADALIAFLIDEPAREEVELLLRGERGAPRIAATNVLEAYDRLSRIRGVPLEAVRAQVGTLQRSRLEIVPLTHDIAAVAAGLRLSHYHRVRSPLSAADCVAAATALSINEPLATTDVPLAKMCREADIEVIALLDSQGRRP